MTIRERPPKNTKNCNLDLSGAMADGYVLGRTNFFETFAIISKKKRPNSRSFFRLFHLLRNPHLPRIGLYLCLKPGSLNQIHSRSRMRLSIGVFTLIKGRLRSL